MLNSTIFTLGQAAQEVGLSKSAMSQAVKKGRVSAKKTSAGSYEIQAAELFRVWPKGGKNQSQKASATQPDNLGAALMQQTALEDKITGLERLVTAADKRTEDAQIERDKWQQQAGEWQQQVKVVQGLISHDEERGNQSKTPAEIPMKSGAITWVLIALTVGFIGLLMDRFGGFFALLELVGTVR